MMDPNAHPESRRGPTVTPVRVARFPRAMFLSAIVIVCLGLAASALYNWLTLSRLRGEYLENRGHDLAVSMDALTRGPGRRNNPALWQSLLDRSRQDHPDLLLYLALLDASGNPLAEAGPRMEPALSRRPGFVRLGEAELYLVEFHLAAPMQRPESGVAGWRLRLALSAAPADFIRRQARLHVLASGIAILVLISLAIYSLRTLRAFLQLKAREESERHLASLGVLSAALAHEIRNPLGAMKGLTQLVQEDLPAGHPSRSMTETVVSEAERLEKLVADLLAFARPPKAELRSFDLAELLEQVLDELRPGFEKKEIVLAREYGPASSAIRSDPDGLRQVLINVLLNALEAVPPKGKITVRILGQESGRDFRVEIDDNGPGILGRDPEEFFEPFVTASSRGTGLGLAISRRILTAAGGAITLANRPGGGARCTLRLPSRLQ